MTDSPGVSDSTSVPVSRFDLGQVSVNRLGYGAMRLSGPGAFGPPRDHIDTAQYYGPDVVNDLIREALHPYPEGLAIVSKVGARRDRAGRIILYIQPGELRRGIQDNLASLGVGQLAPVNLRLAGGAPADGLYDDQLAAMIQARDAGLTGGTGLSNIGVEHLRRALDATEVVCVQNLFNPTSASMSRHAAN